MWDEIRNFKKCLIMMFAKQEKDVVFFETVMGLAQQRRHCMVECIPLPQHIAKQAPLYFKKVSSFITYLWNLSWEKMRPSILSFNELTFYVLTKPFVYQYLRHELAINCEFYYL